MIFTLSNPECRISQLVYEILEGVPQIPRIISNDTLYALPSFRASWDGNLTVLISFENVSDYFVEIDSIVKSHIPDNTTYFDDDIGRNNVSVAKTEWKNLGEWATWTPEEAELHVQIAIFDGILPSAANDWVDVNVTDFASAKEAMKVIVSNIMTIRNILSIIVKVLVYIKNIAIKKL